MKTKIVIVSVAVILIGLLGTGVAIQYQTYKTKTAQAAAVEQKEKTDTETRHKVEINSLNARLSQLTAECQKGVAAYGLLPLPTRSKTPQPVCGDVSTN